MLVDVRLIVGVCCVSEADGVPNVSVFPVAVRDLSVGELECVGVCGAVRVGDAGKVGDGRGYSQMYPAMPPLPFAMSFQPLRRPAVPVAVVTASTNPGLPLGSPPFQLQKLPGAQDEPVEIFLPSIGPAFQNQLEPIDCPATRVCPLGLPCRSRSRIRSSCACASGIVASQPPSSSQVVLTVLSTMFGPPPLAKYLYR